MKIHLSLAALAATIILPGFAHQAHAQEQVVETLVCQSTLGNRASCPINGEIVSAGISRQIGESTPCFLNYTWGFSENGLWTGNGCSAEFAVTVERAAPQPVADPAILRDRLRQTRAKLREARKAVVQEQESRRALEAELAEAQSALRAAEAAAPGKVKRKRRPQMAIRSVSVCSNKAVREATKAGGDKPRVSEIVMARPTQGTWLVIGRLITTYNNNKRSANYFRCWSEKGKVVNFENSL